MTSPETELVPLTKGPMTRYEMRAQSSKTGEFIYYQVKEIYAFVTERLVRLGCYKNITVRESRRGVPHMTLLRHKQDHITTMSICWFGGSHSRHWRGFKIWHPYPSSFQKRAKFVVMDHADFKVWEPGDPDPRQKIIEAVNNLVNYLESLSD